MKGSVLIVALFLIRATSLSFAEIVPQTEPRWTNSLGMVFVPIPGAPVQFCIWETRVQDYTTFAQATDQLLPPRSNHRSSGRRRWSWQQPGFNQDSTHPVVWVSWEEAEEFCAWLTQHEQAAHTIRADQYYRLPTDAEWSQAAGKTKYPWSEMLPPATAKTNETGQVVLPTDDRLYFPPPKGAGNYAGSEIREAETGTVLRMLKRYEDSFARTAPVGSFQPNRHGLYDVGGNVWEWCGDWFHKGLNSNDLEQKLPYSNVDLGGQVFKVLRGASWLDSHPAVLRSDCRFFEFPDHSSDTIGFRVVLAPRRGQDARATLEGL